MSEEPRPVRAWAVMGRRTFLGGLMASAAGIMVPGAVVAEPERRIWALDGTMIGRNGRLVLSDLAMAKGAYGVGGWLRIGDEFMQIVGVVPVEMSRHSVVTVVRDPDGGDE